VTSSEVNAAQTTTATMVTSYSGFPEGRIEPEVCCLKYLRKLIMIWKHGPPRAVKDTLINPIKTPEEQLSNTMSQLWKCLISNNLHPVRPWSITTNCDDRNSEKAPPWQPQWSLLPWTFQKGLTENTVHYSQCQSTTLTAMARPRNNECDISSIAISCPEPTYLTIAATHVFTHPDTPSKEEEVRAISTPFKETQDLFFKAQEKSSFKKVVHSSNTTNAGDYGSRSCLSSDFDDNYDNYKGLEDCNYSEDNEELFPSPSVDRVDLFDPINDKTNRRVKYWMRDGAEKINIDDTHKQSCKKRESSLDGDIYHYIWNTNQTMGEYKIQLPTTMVKVNKSITAFSHTPVLLHVGRCFPSNN
jgi:hypothetical protein